MDRENRRTSDDEPAPPDPALVEACRLLLGWGRAELAAQERETERDQAAS